MKLKKWQLAAVLTVAAVTVVAIVAQLVLSRRRSARARVTIADACRASNDTTFVMLVTDDAVAPAAAAVTLHALFSAAACPLHVFVGLYEVVPDDVERSDAEDPVLMHYKALVAASDFPFQLVAAHVRVLRIPRDQYKGGVAAREQLLRYLYRGETNVMCLACPAVLTPRWDAKLTTALARLEAQHVRGAVLTTKPAAVAAHAASMDALQTALETAPPTFVAVHGRSSALARADPDSPADAFAAPQIRAFSFKGNVSPATAPVPALAWSHAFSFSRGVGTRRDVLPLPLPRGIVGNEDVMDWLVSFLLFLERRVLLHPPFAVAFSLQPMASATASSATCASAGAADAHEDNKYEVAAMARVRSRALMLEHFLQRPDAAQAFYDAVGVKSDTGWPSARARLGLTHGANSDEISAKVGSVSQYMSLLARVDLARPAPA